MNELELIAHIQRKAKRARKELIVGIGDDAAVYRVPGSKEDLLFTTDLMVEGVHFLPSQKPGYVGAKALGRSLSDIAAMGGDPRFCLVSLALPPGRKRFIEPFYEGLLEVADRYRTVVAGGDLSQSAVITCDVMVCGSVAQGSALLRNTARAGDTIWVSGPLGRAASKKYKDLPSPRLDLASKLRGRATACMDVSDGLSIDLHRLCLASGVSAELDEVPVFRGATLENALAGGEDYELVFTTRGSRAPRGCLKIGRISPGVPGLIFLSGKPVEVAGHDHFSSATLK
ncbi:MAG TPA: thiamine-phosphate kinase [Bryobacteraceae bacterium]|nr:thiamine-phosphate kinase [Bryobacteraceae bacterium]